VFALFYLLKKGELWYKRRKKQLSPSYYKKSRQDVIPLKLDIYGARDSDDDFSDEDAGFDADDGGGDLIDTSDADDGGGDIDSFDDDISGGETINAIQNEGAYIRKVKMTSNRHKYEDPIALAKKETEEETEKRIEDNTLLSFKNRLINAYLLLLSLVYLVRNTYTYPYTHSHTHTHTHTHTYTHTHTHTPQVMVSTALELFDCTVRKDGIATLDVFPALECYQTWWWIFMPIGIGSTLAYGIVLPGFYAFLVMHNRHRLATPMFIERYGSIYSGTCVCVCVCVLVCGANICHHLRLIDIWCYRIQIDVVILGEHHHDP